MAADEARRELGLPEAAVVLAMVGDDLVARGFERVLFAIAAMPADAREGLQLVAAGGLPKRFMKAVRVLGLAERVHVWSASPDTVLAAADMLVDLPYKESTNATMLDAMALGVVVFTTENVAESALVRDAKASVVLPLPYAQAACNRALLESVQAAIENTPCRSLWCERSGELAHRPSGPPNARETLCAAQS